MSNPAGLVQLSSCLLVSKVDVQIILSSGPEAHFTSGTIDVCFGWIMFAKGHLQLPFELWSPVVYLTDGTMMSDSAGLILPQGNPQLPFEV